MESKTGRKGDEHTSNRSLEGRRTTWRWGARARGRRDLPRAPTRARSQQVREVRGAVFMCWMIKQEAPEYKKPKEQVLAYSELAATKGKDHFLASAVGKRQHSGSGKRGGSGKPHANVGRHGTRGSFRFGTSLQAGQSVRPSSEPSRTRHQRGTTPRTHSCGTRTNRANRRLGQAPSGTFERELSAAIEQNWRM